MHFKNQFLSQVHWNILLILGTGNTKGGGSVKSRSLKIGLDSIVNPSSQEGKINFN